MSTALSGVLEGVTEEQLESFRRDGLLIIQEGFLSPRTQRVARGAAGAVRVAGRR
jgi:hypothetical protein